MYFYSQLVLHMRKQARFTMSVSTPKVKCEWSKAAMNVKEVKRQNGGCKAGRDSKVHLDPRAHQDPKDHQARRVLEKHSSNLSDSPVLHSLAKLEYLH